MARSVSPGSKRSRQHDSGPPVQERQGQHVPAARVEKRRVGEGHVVVAQVPARGRVDRVPGDAPVGQQRALGPAGGPAGIQKEKGRVVSDALGGHGLGLDPGGHRREHRSKHRRKAGLPGIVQAHHGQVAGALGQCLGSGRHVGAPEEHPRLAVRENERHLVGREAPVDRHEHGAQLGRGEQQIDLLQAVRSDDRHPLARSDGEGPAQEHCHSVRARVQLSIGERPPASEVHDRRFFGGHPGPAGQPVAVYHPCASLSRPRGVLPAVEQARLCTRTIEGQA